MKRRLVLALLALAAPLWAGQKNLAGSTVLTTNSATELTALETAYTVVDTGDNQRFYLFNVAVNNQSNRTIQLTLRLDVDAVTFKSDQVSVDPSNQVVQLAGTHGALALGSHTIEAFVTSDSPNSAVLSTNTFLGVFGKAEAGTALSFADQTANTFFAGPASGAAAAPAFRTFDLAVDPTGLLSETLGGTGANNTPTSGRYLKGDGSNFVTSATSAAGAGSCTNQFVRATVTDAAPTCATVSLTADVTGVLPNTNTTAASANTASAIVARDASGNFSAGTVTATLSGNASTSTALAANGANCAAGEVAAGVSASGASEGCQADQFWLTGATDSAGAPADNVTKFMTLSGVNVAISATEDDVVVVAPVAGTVREMHCLVATAPDNGGGVQDRTFTIRAAAADLATTCTISETATTCTGTPDGAFSGGNKMAVKLTATGTPAASGRIRCSLIASKP